jgi:hypothetical protein
LEGGGGRLHTCNRDSAASSTISDVAAYPGSPFLYWKIPTVAAALPSLSSQPWRERAEAARGEKEDPGETEK